MAWDDEAPSKGELTKLDATASKGEAWDAAPPTDSELGKPSILDKKVPIVGGTPRGYIQGALNALPTAGAAAGGLLGGAAGTALEPGGGTVAGGVAGAGLGDAAGESLKNLGEKYILGQNKTRSDIYLKPGAGLIQGEGQEAGGQLLNAGTSKAGDLLANSPTAQKIGSYVGGAASKIGSALTGVPEKEIATYAQHAAEINDMAKASDNNSFLAANDLRDKWSGEIQGLKKNLNNQISSALESRADQTVSANPIMEALENQKAKLNSKLDPEQINQIGDLQSKVQSLADKDGNISLSDAHDLKNHLQDIAAPTYNSGPIFQSGKNTQKAAQAGARATRGLINDAAPEVANANNQLAELHDIEDSMNKNILEKNAPEASILAAGNEGNQRNAEGLRRLSDMTGTDMNADAQKLSAMRTFGNPSLLPIDTTGKATTRIGLGAAAGGLIGHEVGAGAGTGAFIGAALTSPKALKSAIDAGLLTKKAAQEILSNPQAAGLLMRNGFTHPQDATAIQWAKTNPRDPRSASILKANGM